MYMASSISAIESVLSSARRPRSAMAAFSRSARRCSVTSCSCEKKNGVSCSGSIRAAVTMASTIDPSGRRYRFSSGASWCAFIITLRSSTLRCRSSPCVNSRIEWPRSSELSTIQKRAQGTVDAHDLKLRRHHHHPDRRILEPTPSALEIVARRGVTAGTPHAGEDQRDRHGGQRNRIGDRQPAGVRERQRACDTG